MSDAESGSSASEAKGPPRRRTRRISSAPRTLPTTEAGDKTGNDFRLKLGELVDSAAQDEASRRRATAVDRPDYESAFVRIVGPSRRRSSIEIISDVGTAIGSGLIGFAVNVYTGGSTNLLAGHISMFAGVSLNGLAIVLKYLVSGQ